MRGIQVAGLCCAFAGVVAVFYESLSFPTRRMLIGDGMLTAAALLWGATTVLIKASPMAFDGGSTVDADYPHNRVNIACRLNRRGS